MKDSESIFIKRKSIPIRSKKKSSSRSNSRSTRLLDRAGYISDFGSGLYGLTVLGQETRRRIENLVRRKHNSIGCHEVSIPSLQYSKDWMDSGRWEKFEGEMFTFENRDGSQMCLAPTHEEGVVRMFDEIIRSYNDLPATVFQIKEKHRDDKAREGLLRSKEFVMKDAYSMHSNKESMYRRYEEMKNLYRDIFDTLDLEVAEVDAGVGVMGGSESMEFVAPSKIGDDDLLYCPECNFGITDEHDEYSNYKPSSKCPQCSEKLEEDNGIEVGHIFALGRRYSSTMDFVFDTLEGGKEDVYMASYGIGITRIMQAVIDQRGRKESCRWNISSGFTASPFDACVITGEEINDKTIENIKNSLRDTNKRFLLYDEIGIGEQFSESDLIGIPVKIILGNHWTEENEVEIELYNNDKIYCKMEKIEERFNGIWESS